MAICILYYTFINYHAYKILNKCTSTTLFDSEHLFPD